VSARAELVTLSREIVENEGRVGARGATLELARGYLALAEAYEFDVAIPLAELREELERVGLRLDQEVARAEARLERAVEAEARLEDPNWCKRR
jgi:hypothetical protein